jgi:dipeptidyl aminopeptidase/acylaminoacyl peptidase
VGSVFAVVLLSLAPSVAHATTYGGAGRIAFAGLDAMGNTHIWTTEADGTDKVDLTPGSTDHHIDPDWSPDGASIAFSKGPSSSAADIWRMDAGGGNPVQLTTSEARERQPEWSPDGSTIVFESGARIVTMSAVDGSGRTALGKGDTPTYSPEGNRIVFARFRNGFSDIYSMKTDGSRVRNLTETPSISEFNPDWAPDGRTIAFQRSQRGDHDIWTMQPDGNIQYLITRNKVFDGFASYSPDGTAFVMVRSGRLVTINASGPPETTVAEASLLGNAFASSWQPRPCTVTGTPGDDPALDGTAGDDVICGLGGNDVIHALDGNDTIIGGGGSDELFGEGGDDTIAGAAGADELVGAAGDDRLTGDSAKDVHRGGADDDYIFTWDRAGGDVLFCGVGSDRIAFEPADIVRC